MHCRLLSRLAQPVAVAAALCLPLGCLGDASDYEALGELHQPVVGGYLAEDNPSVVYLPGCSGTLIAPNLVLTALHCIAPITGDDNFTCAADGTLKNPPNGQLGGHRDPAEIAITIGHQFSTQVDAVGFELLSTQSTQICQNDLAFVILDRDLDLPLSPVRLKRPVELGEVLSVVGYGLTNNPKDLPAGEGVARRRRDAVRVLALGSTSANPNGGDALPRTFALGESVCKGDSGGPAFSKEGAVVGVYSTLVGGCTGPGARNFYTMLSEFQPLVLQAYELAGATPWLSGQTAPGQEPEVGIPDAGRRLTTAPEPSSGQAAVSTGYCSLGIAATSSEPANGWWAIATLLGLVFRRRTPRD